MRKGTFIFNNVLSSELNSLIQERPNIPSAKRKVTRKEIPGVSGDYIFDEKAWENVSFELAFFAKGKNEEEVNYLRDLISATFNVGNYVDMIIYSDEHHIYEVIIDQEPEFEQDGRFPLILPYKISFSAKPFKKMLYDDIYQGTSSLTIINRTSFTSKPEITMYGNGDMNLQVNGLVYTFKEIDEHVNIDSVTENAYKQIGSQILNRNHRMFTMDFPMFNVGANSIQVTGGATGFRVNPNWRIKL